MTAGRNLRGAKRSGVLVDAIRAGEAQRGGEGAQGGSRAAVKTSTARQHLASEVARQGSRRPSVPRASAERQHSAARRCEQGGRTRTVSARRSIVARKLQSSVSIRPPRSCAARESEQDHPGGEMVLERRERVECEPGQRVALDVFDAGFGFAVRACPVRAAGPRLHAPVAAER